jgi:peptidyl-prolyl cis-trans isomerase B (cyclophilin B)
MLMIRGLLCAALVGVFAFAWALPNVTDVVPAEAARARDAVIVDGTVNVPVRGVVEASLSSSYSYSAVPFTVQSTALVPLRPVVEWLGGSLKSNGGTISVNLPLAPQNTATLVFEVGECGVYLQDAYLGTGLQVYKTYVESTKRLSATDSLPDVELSLPVLQSTGVTYVTARGLATALNLLTSVPVTSNSVMKRSGSIILPTTAYEEDAPKALISSGVTVGWDADQSRVVFRNEGLTLPNLYIRDWTRTIYANIQTEKGQIVVRLCQDDAPLTVNNFIALVTKGFYDGLTFHRVEKGAGFQLIQGGDPNGNGTGGPGYTIQREIAPLLKHSEGAVAMARSADPNSAGSQFYICNCAIPQLDGQYAVFGYVVEGLDVSKQIVIGDTMDTVTLFTMAPGTLATPDGERTKVVLHVPYPSMTLTSNILRTGSAWDDRDDTGVTINL